MAAVGPQQIPTKAWPSRLGPAFLSCRLGEFQRSCAAQFCAHIRSTSKRVKGEHRKLKAFMRLASAWVVDELEPGPIEESRAFYSSNMWQRQAQLLKRYWRMRSTTYGLL